MLYIIYPLRKFCPWTIKKIIELSEGRLSKIEIVRKLGLFPKDVTSVRAKYILFKYIQGKSVNELEQKYRLHHEEINEILTNNNVHALDHKRAWTFLKRITNLEPFDSPFERISKKLTDFICGNLLGDANIQINSRRNFKSVQSILELLPENESYIEALNYFDNFRINEFNYSMDLNEAILKFNQFSKVITNAPSSYLRMGKSIIELPFLEQCLRKQYEQNAYQTGLGVRIEKHYNNSDYTGTFKVKVSFQTKSTIQLTQTFIDWKNIQTLNFSM